MKKYTLAEVCKKIESYGFHNFLSPLQIICLGGEPDGHICDIGRCVVEKSNGEFRELFIDDTEHGLYHDGDLYGVDVEQIYMWDFMNDVLTVYIETEWI